MNTNHIVWTNNTSLDDWRDWLNQEYPDITDDTDRYRVITEELDSQFDDVLSDLNIELPDTIICIADLQLWNGHRMDYSFCGTNLSNTLRTGCGDYRTWYIDDLGDLRCDDTHHDGTNHYLFRMLKPTISSAPLRRKILSGTVTRRDITRCTSPIGAYVADVYGWKVRRDRAV